MEFRVVYRKLRVSLSVIQHPERRGSICCSPVQVSTISNTNPNPNASDFSAVDVGDEVRGSNIGFSEIIGALSFQTASSDVPFLQRADGPTKEHELAFQAASNLTSSDHYNIHQVLNSANAINCKEIHERISVLAIEHRTLCSALTFLDFKAASALAIWPATPFLEVEVKAEQWLVLAVSHRGYPSLSLPFL